MKIFSHLIILTVFILFSGCGNGLKNKTGDNDSDLVCSDKTGMDDADCQTDDDSVEPIWTEIDAGLFHTCGIYNGNLYCWGYNSDSQIGDRTKENRCRPVMIDEKKGWGKISSGHFHSCAIREGELYCWGENTYGQVGNPGYFKKDNPIRIDSFTDWQSVSAGYRHTCGIRNGSLYCWGESYQGKLGNG